MAIPGLSGGPRDSIRSYELRQGRLTVGQRRALEQHWESFGVTTAAGVLGLNEIFGRRAPRVLDIGSGMGDTIATLAEQHPENDYLALEVHLPGVGALIRHAAEKELRNLRILRADAKDVVGARLPLDSLDEVWIFFSGPLGQTASAQATAGESGICPGAGAAPETKRTPVSGHGLAGTGRPHADCL